MITLVALALATTREDALDNAAAFALHTWTATSANYTASCSSDYASNYAAGTYMGLPYDWGGYMDIATFDAGIAAGDGAGSHSWHGSLECTVGLDCSGFVSMVWEVGHYSTSTFYGTTHDIGWEELERADAVNDAGSHIVLYTHLSEGGWPVWYEASGGADKVHLNSDGGWSYLDGYQPVREDGIEDGGTTGTAAAPILIPGFPYTDYRWTAGAASDVVDAYNCSPADESGPEMFYRFHTDTGGTLTARVSDDSEVDIDLHVLTAPDGESCLARDDTELSVHVPAGDVWLALDSYVGGHEYPGPYILTADFVPDPVEDTDPGTTAPTDSGDPAGTDADPSGGDGRDTPPAAHALPGERASGPGGCGCAAGPRAAGFAAWGLAALAGAAAAGRRRRR